MYKQIGETARCSLFEGISREIWNKIIIAHDVKTDVPEIGLTAGILVDILQFSKYHIPNFDVYAKPGWNENIYGSDIEIHIETLPNQYRMFALQAKVLKKNNRYDTLRDSSNHIMQWEKLTLLEGVSGCKSYYLLFNGRKNFKYIGADKCGNAFSQDQFGCSLVEPSVIEIFATRRNRSGTRYSNPKFEEIHPSFAQPWRILTCCLHDLKEKKLYTITEIIESNPLLERIDYEGDYEGNLDELDDNEYEGKNEVPVVEGNILNLAYRESGWYPTLRIIVKRTPAT